MGRTWAAFIRTDRQCASISALCELCYLTFFPFEVCSASIATENYRTNWNPESDNRRKGELILYKHYIHSAFVEKTFPFSSSWLSPECSDCNALWWMRALNCGIPAWHTRSVGPTFSQRSYADWSEYIKPTETSHPWEDMVWLHPLEGYLHTCRDKHRKQRKSSKLYSPLVMRKSIDTIDACLHNIRSINIKIDVFDSIVCFFFFKLV